MAKIYGLFGAMSGKVADVVMSVRNGQQIVRKYQPVVSNPKTQNQYTTRARFKLISQLSAIMAPVIAIPRLGGVSSRNRFSSVNFANTSFDGNTASVDLANMQLTASAVGFPAVLAERGAANIEVSLDIDEGVPLEGFDRVVYAMFVRQDDDSLMFGGSAVVTEGGTNGDYPANLPLTERSTVVYAYGMRDNSAVARLYFGNTEVTSAAMVAQLIVSHSLSDADVTLSHTSGVVVGGIEPSQPAVLTIVRRGTGSGTFSGAGNYHVGQRVTIFATAASGSTFGGWYSQQSGGTPISTSNPYQITLSGDTTIYCDFANEEG